MSQMEKKKVRIGRKEQKILEYLQKHPEGVWKSDIINEFSWAKRYDGVVSKRLENMAKKGLIRIVSEINPETGKSKLRVYLNQ